MPCHVRPLCLSEIKLIRNQVFTGSDPDEAGGKGRSALLRTEVSLLVPVTHFQDAVLLPVSIRKRMAISLLLLLFPDKPETLLVLLKSQTDIFGFFPSVDYRLKGK